MKQTKIGHRVIVVVGPARAAEKIDGREPADQQVTSRRIVVIKDGQFVGSKPGR
jgi:hypothetical protein